MNDPQVCQGGIWGESVVICRAIGGREPPPLAWCALSVVTTTIKSNGVLWRVQHLVSIPGGGKKLTIAAPESKTVLPYLCQEWIITCFKPSPMCWNLCSISTSCFMAVAKHDPWSCPDQLMLPVVSSCATGLQKSIGSVDWAGGWQTGAENRAGSGVLRLGSGWWWVAQLPLISFHPF